MLAKRSYKCNSLSLTFIQVENFQEDERSNVSLSLSPLLLLFKCGVTDRTGSQVIFFSVTGSHSWPRGKNVVQSEAAETSTCNDNAPATKSQKATDFFVIGGASAGIMNYCLCFR